MAHIDNNTISEPPVVEMDKLEVDVPAGPAENPQQIVCDILETTTPPKPFEIKSTKDKGLGMFAKDFIPRGMTILEEEPLVILRGQHYTPEEIEAAFGQLTPENKEKYLSLHSIHGLKDGDPNPLLVQNYESKVRASVMGRLAARQAKTKSAVSIFFANSMSAGDHAAVVLYEASRVNHSCVPNASYVWSEELGVERIRAVKDIPAGEEITISYCYHFLKPNQRIRYLEQVYGFTCSCLACFDRTIPDSFAAKSHDRRWKLAELDAVSYSDQTLELKAKGQVATLIVAEGLCIPHLGIAYDALSKIWENRGNTRYAKDFARKALDVFTTCLGPDYPTTKEQSSRLQQLEGNVQPPARLSV